VLSVSIQTGNGVTCLLEISLPQELNELFS
jgi:hypothetical protein